MVKANGYGHGIDLLMPTIQRLNLTNLGVALVEEAIELRDLGFNKEILMFGLFPSSAVPYLENFKITPVVGNWEQLKSLGQNLKEFLKIHLKFNTGMNRMGFNIDEVQKVLEFLNSHSKISVTGLCQHFHSGDDPQSRRGQLEIFRQVLPFFKDRKLIFHVYNSSGFLSSLVERNNVSADPNESLGVRPGIALYGYSSTSVIEKLKPVMTVVSEVVLQRKLKINDVVSYGATFKATKAMTIGVVEMGYADGYSRQFSNKGEVLVAGTRAPVLGRVCMDSFIVDLTEALRKSNTSDLTRSEVLIFGKSSQGEISAEEIAQNIGTISYEILTSISRRVPRIVC